MTLKNFTSVPEQWDLVQNLAALKEAPFEFHLTGSRFFGNAHHDSDWDFFTEDSIEVREFLQNQGFENLNDKLEVNPKDLYREDPNIATVFESVFAKVQVQLVQNVGQKIVAQDILKESPIRACFLKDAAAGNWAARPWWQWAYKQTIYMSQIHWGKGHPWKGLLSEKE